MKVATEESAGGIVFKKENGKTLWLIISPSSKKWWGFPKGKIGDNVRNETKEDAALREVTEETGVKANIVSEKYEEKHYEYKLRDYLIKKTVYYFLMEYKSTTEASHSFEIAEVKWATEEEVMKLITYQSDKDAFQSLIKSL